MAFLDKSFFYTMQGSTHMENINVQCKVFLGRAFCYFLMSKPFLCIILLHYKGTRNDVFFCKMYLDISRNWPILPERSNPDLSFP